MKLVVDKESLVSVADAIREKGGTSEELEFPNGFVDAVNGIESGGGGTEEIEQIIDQSGVLDSTYGTATEKVEQLIDKAEYEKWLHDNIVTIAFRSFDTGDITLDCVNIESLGGAFASNNSAKKITLTNTQNVKNWGRAFNGCKAETIETLNFSSSTSQSNCFTNTIVVNMKVVPETIKLSLGIHSAYLSAESKQSIFYGLAPVETAQTLTLHKDAKILQSQVDSANAKGWTVAGGTVVSEEEYYG